MTSKVRTKKDRLDMLKIIISRQEMSNQDELLTALSREGFHITQATLSRDLKQLKVAKAATAKGRYIYVLPNVTAYKHVSSPTQIKEMMVVPGFKSIIFSGNMGVIKTRPGYASSIAYNIDNSDIPYILGTIAGDDTIFIVLRETASEHDVVSALRQLVPSMV